MLRVRSGRPSAAAEAAGRAGVTPGQCSRVTSAARRDSLCAGAVATRERGRWAPGRDATASGAGSRPPRDGLGHGGPLGVQAPRDTWALRRCRNLQQPLYS